MGSSPVMASNNPCKTGGHVAQLVEHLKPGIHLYIHSGFLFKNLFGSNVVSFQLLIERSQVRVLPWHAQVAQMVERYSW